jgi:hypothetical protein
MGSTLLMRKANVGEHLWIYLSLVAHMVWEECYFVHPAISLKSDDKKKES